MITVTGQTFAHRETLKAMHGRWSPIEQAWQFDYLTESQIERLRGLVGVVVIEPKPNDRPKPKPRQFNALDDAISTLIAAIHRPNETGETDARYRTAFYGDNRQYFNHFKDKNPAAFFGFSSLTAMANYIERLPEHKQRDGWGNSSDDWIGTRNMDCALDLARNGWNEGIEQAAEILQIINVDHAIQRKRSHSVAGGAVNVGRMLTGNPMHMIKRPKQPGSKIVTIFAESCMSAIISHENMATRAVLVAAMVEVLEREGYSCEVVATDVSTHRNRTFYQLATTLKSAGQRLNLFDIIFGLGHPSFLRRFSFAALSSSDEAWNVCHHQGGPSVMFNEEYPTGRNEFYIRPLQTNVKGDTLRERVLAMLPHVEPQNLPIKLRNEQC